MSYFQRIGEITDKNPKLVLKDFLLTLKDLYSEYLEEKVDDLTVSDITILWFVKSEKFSDAIIELEPRVKDLRAGMDISHPGFSIERKKSIVSELIKRVDEILEE